jgi:hypothetical protein
MPKFSFRIFFVASGVMATLNNVAQFLIFVLATLCNVAHLLILKKLPGFEPRELEFLTIYGG